MTLVIYANLVPNQVIYFMVKAVFGMFEVTKKSKEASEAKN